MKYFVIFKLCMSFVTDCKNTDMSVFLFNFIFLHILISYIYYIVCNMIFLTNLIITMTKAYQIRIYRIYPSVKDQFSFYIVQKDYYSRQYSLNKWLNILFGDASHIKNFNKKRVAASATTLFSSLSIYSSDSASDMLLSKSSFLCNCASNWSIWLPYSIERSRSKKISGVL